MQKNSHLHNAIAGRWVSKPGEMQFVDGRIDFTKTAGLAIALNKDVTARLDGSLFDE